MLATRRGSALCRELRAAPGTLTTRGARLCRLGQPGVAGARPSASGRHGADVESRPLIVGMAGLLVFHLRVQRGRPAERGRHPGDRRPWFHGARQRAGAGRPRAGRRPRRSRAVWVAPIRWSRLRLRAASAQRSSAWSRCPARTGVGWHTRLRQSSRPPQAADGSNGSLIAIPPPRRPSAIAVNPSPGLSSRRARAADVHDAKGTDRGGRQRVRSGGCDEDLPL